MNAQDIKQLMPILQAFAEGKQIQLKCGDRWEDYNNFTFDCSPDQYRIKPTPTLRPWRPEEVPVGAWIRNKTAHETGYTDFTSIIGVTAKSFYTVEDVFEYMEISLEKSIKYVYSLDHGKTWLQCGVVE